MELAGNTRLAKIVADHEKELLASWTGLQFAAISRRGLTSDAELRGQFSQFLTLFIDALGQSPGADITTATWDEVRHFLVQMSQKRASQGFTPVETATFVFSLKQPLFDTLRVELKGDPASLTDMTWSITLVLDALGLFTTDQYQKSREQIIARQQQELLELSTPVVQLWEGVLALPLIGTLDSARTQVVMENLLQKIVDTGAPIAIIDITGVPTVDTLVAQHLLKTVAAARLMGADCIISGIRPQIAQTIVHLGVNLSNVITKATLADAFVVALRLTGSSIGARTGDSRDGRDARNPSGNGGSQGGALSGNLNDMAR